MGSYLPDAPDSVAEAKAMNKPSAGWIGQWFYGRRDRLVEKFFASQPRFIRKRKIQILAEFRSVNGVEFNPSDKAHRHVVEMACQSHKIACVEHIFRKLST